MSFRPEYVALPHVISTGGAKRRSGEISPTPIVIRAKRLSPHCHFDRSGCASTLSFRAERPIGREVEKSHLHSRGLLMPTSKSLCRKRSFVAPAQSTADENLRLGHAVRARTHEFGPFAAEIHVCGTCKAPQTNISARYMRKMCHKRTSPSGACVKRTPNENCRQATARERLRML